MYFGKINRIILLGGGIILSKFASEIQKYDVEVCVFSSKRHLEEKINNDMSLQHFLEMFKIEYIESENINCDQRALKYIDDCTLGISFGASWIFKSNFIDKFNGKLINCHGTRLPQNRGSGGFSWQILRDNRLGYCILHQIDVGIDTGKIIQYREFFYPKLCRIPQDYETLYFANTLDFLYEFLIKVLNGDDFQTVNQQEYFSIYWPRLATKIHGYIDWSWNINDLEKFICAFDEPYEGASTFINGIRVFLKNVFSDYNDGSFHPFQAGIIYRKQNENIFVAAIGGSLIVNNVCGIDGKNIIDKLKVGDRFHTHVECLEKARLYRAIYTPNGLKD